MFSFPEALWALVSQVAELHSGAARGGLCNCLPRWALGYEPTVCGGVTEGSFAAMDTLTDRTCHLLTLQRRQRTV